MANILGISIGTRNVGLAIIRHRKLRDYRIRTFAGKWTPEKCDIILNIVDVLIKQYRITDITLKVPPLSHCSENQEELIKGIRELARWFDAKTHHFTMRDINFSYSGSHKNRHHAMVSALIEKYPELKEKWGNSKKARAYNAKVFEAIACAELALQAGH